MYRKKSNVALHINYTSTSTSCSAVIAFSVTSAARGVTTVATAAGKASGSRTGRKGERREGEGCERCGETDGWDAEGWQASITGDAEGR